MQKKLTDEILSYALTPLSWIYGAVAFVRNKLFDWKILPQEEFEIPIISVGNITVGGTGKTPHAEYIVRRLMTDYRVAVLSRGYKRKTKGFLIANSKSHPDTIGDEPYQIYQKFGNRVHVAVCESRREGIKKLRETYPDIEIVVLDDAFQHRYVKPKVSVLLMDYNHPFYHDKLLPLGRLRESCMAVNRADMVIVSKCPDDLKPINYRLVSKELSLFPDQKLYFSTYDYTLLTPVFPDDSPYSVSLTQLTQRDSVLLLTGVANPRGFVKHFRDFAFKVKVCHFPDHHRFSRRDLDEIKKRFDSMTGERKIIITTEKDAVRLSNNPYFPQQLKRLTFYQPISVRMITTFDDSDFITDLRAACFRTAQPTTQASIKPAQPEEALPDDNNNQNP